MHADRTVTGRRLHTRRALGLVVMSAVVPGSAQFVAGNRALGRVAMRVWAMIWGVVLLSAVALLFVRGPFLAVLLAPGATTVLQIAAWVIFLGWALLLLDAWRLSRPIKLPRPARLALTVSCVVLVSIMGFTTNLAANAFTAAGNVSTVLKGGGDAASAARAVLETGEALRTHEYPGPTAPRAGRAGDQVHDRGQHHPIRAARAGLHKVMLSGLWITRRRSTTPNPLREPTRCPVHSIRRPCRRLQSPRWRLQDPGS